MVKGENSSVPQLLWFGIDGGLKIWRKRVTLSLSLLINDKGVCRTAPATPGLLKNSLGGPKGDQTVLRVAAAKDSLTT